MSASYAKVVREALPHPKLVVDRFHLVKKANEMIDDVRRRVTQDLRGRRGRRHNPEWINRRRLLRGKATMTRPEQEKLVAKLTAFDPNWDLLAAWITKENLRDVLACKERGALRYEVGRKLELFYTFAAACNVPEIRTFANTISTWQDRNDHCHPDRDI